MQHASCLTVYFVLVAVLLSSVEPDAQMRLSAGFFVYRQAPKQPEVSEVEEWGGCRINGLTALNLTKLDVLSDLDKIPLGVAYRLNGRILTAVPADIPALEELEVVYEEMPGWKRDISKVLQCAVTPCNALPVVRNSWVCPWHVPVCYSARSVLLGAEDEQEPLAC
jgi:hypothetical protein